MSEERRRILNMVAEGKITAAEAEELLDAVSMADASGEETISVNSDDNPKTDSKKPKYLRIMVEPKENGGKAEKVNIRIPMLLLRGGVKLASLIPGPAKDKINDKMKDKGIDIDLRNLDFKSLEDIIAGLGGMSIDVDDEKEKVRIFCE